MLWKNLFVNQLNEEKYEKILNMDSINRWMKKKISMNLEVNWKEEYRRNNYGLPLVKGQVLLNKNSYDPQRFTISRDGRKIGIVDEEKYLRIYSRSSRNDPYILAKKTKVAYFDWENKMEFSFSSKRLVVVSKVMENQCIQIEMFECQEHIDLNKSYKLPYEHQQKSSIGVKWCGDETVLLAIHTGSQIAFHMISTNDDEFKEENKDDISIGQARKDNHT